MGCRAGKMRIKGEDQYIDYSCSTSLERLSRDVETMLRSWHIIEGSDRHVSFHDNKKYSNKNLSKRSILRTDASSGQTHQQSNLPPLGHLTKKKLGRQSQLHPPSPKKAIDVDVFHTPGRTPIRRKDDQTNESSQANNDEERADIKLIRSGKVILNTRPLYSNSHTDRIEVELELCLWDGPPSSTPNKEEEEKNNDSGVGNKPSKTKESEKEKIPLSLKSNRNLKPLNYNLLSNLSHLMNIGQHITLSPTSQNSMNLLLESTMIALTHAQQPSRWNKKNVSILRNTERSVEQEVALYTTALHSLSSQLQMVLNTAAVACDCRIPSFGIWGLYRSSVQNDTGNASIPQASDKLTQSQSIMDIPLWMNTGNLFSLAAESSSIGAFLQCMENNAQKEEECDDSIALDDSYDDCSDMDEVSHQGGHVGFLSLSNQSPMRKNTKKVNQMKLSPKRNNYGKTNSKATKDLHLPAFINGNCHPGSSFFGTGATFAIHVVPPGVEYPVHCTTLHSLGELLLQHCPSVSLSGLLKMHLNSKEKMNKINVEDRNMQRKVAVVAARHKYTWSNIFQYGEDCIPRQHDLLLASPTSYRCREAWHEFNSFTFGLSWRQSCAMGVDNFHTAASTSLNESFDDTLVSLMQYRQSCREKALTLVYRASCIAKTRRSRKNLVVKKALEPSWGPVTDPITMVSVGVRWGGTISSPESRDNACNSTIPLLNLPLRIRSQNRMTSQDVLEMENAIISTIFNPLSVPSTDFNVHVKIDPETACTTLSATNRCLLAALIRTSTLESDTLIAHLTKSSILEELHDRHEMDFAAEEIMDKSSLSPVTRKLVEVLDWGNMADMMDDEAWSDSVRFEEILNHILQPNDYPIPPEAAFDPTQIISDILDSESAAQSCVDNGSPPGRLLSALFTSMSSLQTPSAMSALWLSFISALRLRWDQKERLNNLENIPGIDDILPTSRAKKSHIIHTLGDKAKNAAFFNSTESEPNLNDCLINQKLQAFNIGVEALINLEMKKLEDEAISINLPQSAEDSVSQQTRIKISIKDDDFESFGDDNSGFDNDSCDFRSCGTRDDGDDDDDISLSPSNRVILNERLHSLSQLRENNSAPTQFNRRKGARCPVQGSSLSSSGDQLYAPYLQRAPPLTGDVIIERRKMLADTPTNSIENRIEIAQRLQKPKVVNDMSAFKAANPNAIFQDFISWYGNPENPLEIYNDKDIFNSADFLQFANKKSPEEEMNEAILVLNSTRSFWTNCWDESEPIPASEQKPLFDSYSTVEMLLLSLETMHPSILMNQILAVNLSTANFILKASAPSCRMKVVDDAISKMERNINNALILLNKDVSMISTMPNEKIHKTNSFRFISVETVSACERACDCIANVEVVLARTTSLLTKFSGDVETVQQCMDSDDTNMHVEAHSFTSRSGILKSIHAQQQNNSGTIFVNTNDLPTPSVREYILRNNNDEQPCQLTVCIGGTHGLEKGGPNSTKGGFVLAMNKCVKGIQ